MKFSAIIAISTLVISGVSALPLEMVYRSHGSYYRARDVLPSGRPYPRAAMPDPIASAASAVVTDTVPPVNPALDLDATDETNPDAQVYKNGRRLTARQRRDAIRSRSPVPDVYEREAEPEAVAEPEAEPEASPEADADPLEDDDDDDILLDEASRAALLRRLINAEEKAAEKKADEYIRSFRFHRRAADYASY